MTRTTDAKHEKGRIPETTRSYPRLSRFSSYVKNGALIGGMLAVLVVAALACGGGEPGVLEGDVSIGPISPVHREGVEEVIPPEVYAARKVLVKEEGGRRVLEEVDLGDDGHYRIELPAGRYVVDINNIGVDHAREVPAEILITSGETTVLDIDIDTGIR